MTSSEIDITKFLAKEVWFHNQKLYVKLSDNREVGVPIEWFPRLAKATKKQLDNWRLIGQGMGIHWEDVDEDISVIKLFLP